MRPFHSVNKYIIISIIAYSNSRKPNKREKKVVEDNQFLLFKKFCPNIVQVSLWVFLLFFKISSNKHHHHIIIKITQSKVGIQG